MFRRAAQNVCFPLRKVRLSKTSARISITSQRNEGIILQQDCTRISSVCSHTPVRNFHVNFINLHQANDLTVSGSRSGDIRTSHDRMLLKYGEFDLQLLYMWLRDHCRCDTCYNHATFQKNVENYKVSAGERPAKVEFDGQILILTWHDKHVTTYDISWLVDNTYHAQHTNRVDKCLWNKAILEEERLPTVGFKDYMDTEEGMKKHLHNLVKYGFSIVTETPADHHRGTLEVASKLCFLQETHFGKDWTLMPNMERGDTAYTNIALAAHTDNTYFTTPSGIQVFHVLEHDGTGGQTLLVDGQFCAEQLKSKHPDDFDLLTKSMVPHEYYEEEMRMRSLGTVLSVHPTTGKFLHLRYNPYDRAPLFTLPPGQQKMFYKAYDNLGKEIRNKDNEFWVRLLPGMVLFVDNWRVMHGRAAFTGRRWVSGCYLPRDDWVSKARLFGLLNL